MTADSGARVHLTTQSATKLYRMDGGEARQDLRFELSPGAYVENMPDALIPQAGTRYRQRTVVELAAGATFVSAETIAPGRRAHGERFAYDLLELTTEVRRDGRELLRRDACAWSPGASGPTSRACSAARTTSSRCSPSRRSRTPPRWRRRSTPRSPRAKAFAARRASCRAAPAPSCASSRRTRPAPSVRCAAPGRAARHALLGLPLPERRK